MDLGGLPVRGEQLSDWLRLQAAHGVVLVPGETDIGPKGICQRYGQKRKYKMYLTTKHNPNKKTTLEKRHWNIVNITLERPCKLYST
jgi:hypothetical protein